MGGQFNCQKARVPKCNLGTRGILGNEGIKAQASATENLSPPIGTSAKLGRARAVPRRMEIVPEQILLVLLVPKLHLGM